MSEEEKEAINNLKEYTDSYVYVKNHCENLNKKDYMEKHPTMEAIITILSLIEKQQKELEEVRQANKRLFEMCKDKAMTKLTNEIIENDYISKDKIRDKIKELESHIWKDGYMTKFDEYAIHYLKELLEE